MSADSPTLQGSEVKLIKVASAGRPRWRWGRARRNEDAVAARPPAREAGPESIKPLSKQSCSVCTVVEACGPRSAGSRHTSSVKSEPSSQLCLHGSSPARWRPRGAGQPRAGRRWAGAAPLPASSHTAGMEVRYLDETGLRGENKDIEVGLFSLSHLVWESSF